MRPALRLDADRGAQVDVGGARVLGAHVAPPVQEFGLPVLERALQRLVARKLHVVRNLFVVVDAHQLRGHRLRCGERRDAGPRRLHAFPVEFRLVAAAEHLERTGLAHGIRADEDPVLPRREPTEHARFHRLGAGEAQVGLHPGQRVGREACAFLERDADLVGPIEIVGRGGDEAERHAPRRHRAQSIHRLPLRARSAPSRRRTASRCACARSPSDRRRNSSPTVRSSARRLHRREGKACSCDRRQARARRACRRSTSRGRSAHRACAKSRRAGRASAAACRSSRARTSAKRAFRAPRRRRAPGTHRRWS